MAAPRPASPNSLPDWLRTRTDDQLADLLRRRPDLGLPAPPDLQNLAARLTVRTSVQRALDTLDRFTLRVLENLILGAAPAPDEHDALDTLRRLALVWGDDEPTLVPGVADALGPYPTGLGRPAAQLLPAVSDVTLARVLRTLELPRATQPQSGAAVAAVLTDPPRLGALLDALPEVERDVLDRLAAGPPVGTVRGAQNPTDLESATAAHRLVARGLLLPIDSQTVELPREVGRALRARRPPEAVRADPPPIELVTREPAELDRLGTTAVLDLLRLVETLGNTWSRLPPVQLRAGGLGVREMRRTARDLGVDEAAAALVVEVAAAAGLIGPTNGIEPVFLPTPEYDTWRAGPADRRWATLASAWLSMTRQPSLIGERGERDRMVAALGPDVERGLAPALRLTVLGVLADLPPGSAPADRAEVLTRLAWLAPRRARSQRSIAEAVLAEADLLGLTAAGGLTGYGRAVRARSAAGAQDSLRVALPEPVQHILVQPDLTVVVPGPPVATLAVELALVADLESSGGASVYRVTEATIRRALDAGRTSADLSDLFARRSRTPIPQALTYLIEDAGRRHGVLRSGPAAAYLRCDDETLLSRVLSERAVESAGLRRLAPTVVVSPLPVARLLEVLREAGFAPAAESPDGAVVTLSEDEPRAPSRPAARIVRPRPDADSAGQLAEVVRRVRSGDALAEMSRRVTPLAQQVPGVTSATTLGLLRDAVRGSRSVWLSVTDDAGQASAHMILPISLGGGMLRGHERATSALRSFPLHRITAVSLLDEEPED